MPLRIDVPEKFLNLFHKIFENEPIENGNKLNLFSLKISNNAFSYATLVEELGDILTAYDYYAPFARFIRFSSYLCHLNLFLWSRIK